MRILHVGLTNFRSHRNLACHFDRFNFIVGENGSGKSSIALAVEFALTGRASGITDQGGKGADDLIALGESGMRIGMAIRSGSDTTNVYRTKTPHSHELQVGPAMCVPLAMTQKRLYDILGVSGDVLSACLNSGRFLAMAEKDQKQLLAQVLASDPPKIPDGVRADMEALCGVEMWDGKSLDVPGIDSLYKIFFDTRTADSRELKGLGVMAAPEIPEDTPSYESVKTKLDGLRKELSAFTNESARAQERYRSTLEANERQRKAISERKSEVERAMLTESEAEKFQAVIDSSDKAKKLSEKLRSIEASIAVKKSEIDQTRALEAGQLREQLAENARQITIRETMIATIVGIKGAECPTCQRKLTAKEKSDIGAHLDAEISALNAKGLDLTAKLDASVATSYPEEIEKLIASRIDLERQLSEIGDIAAAESRMRQHREAIVEMGRCERELKAVADPNPPKTGDLSEKIDSLNERIAAGEEVLKNVAEIQREVSEYKSWLSKKEALEKKLAVLERLIAFFGPNGVKQQMLGDKVGPFVEQMNAALEPFGYSITFSLEPYGFLVSALNQYGLRKINQLSKSESWRFGVAFQIALAKATGLNFAVIDEADILFGDNRSAFVEMILESGLDQAIVLYSGTNPGWQIEGVKFIQLGAKEKAAAA